MLWGSLWAAGQVGAIAGGYIYEERYAPPAPYTEAQLRSMGRASPEAVEMANREVGLWRESVEMGKAVASLEGTLAGSMMLLACWATGAIVWMWGRERERLVRSEYGVSPRGEY
jgi:hypothetical protein